MKSGCAKTTFAGTRGEIRQIRLASAEDASTGNAERLEQLQTLHEAET